MVLKEGVWNRALMVLRMILHPVVHLILGIPDGTWHVMIYGSLSYNLAVRNFYLGRWISDPFASALYA